MGVPQNGYTMIYPKMDSLYWKIHLQKKSTLWCYTVFPGPFWAQPEDHLPGWIRLPRGLATAIPLFTTAKRGGKLLWVFGK